MTEIEEFLDFCSAVGIDWRAMKEDAAAAVRHHSQPKEKRYAELVELERHWYRSVAAGQPDYDVYGTTAYVADCWACWIVYARKYLRALANPNGRPGLGSVAAGLAPVASIVDLGCGLGFSTAELIRLFPAATVTATNLGNTPQTRIAELVGQRYGFHVEPTPVAVGPVDVVFASEYFEHFAAPLDHLAEVLDACEPRALIHASSFGARSIGHFDYYRVGMEFVSPTMASRRFSSELRRRGYRKLKTSLWNNRPAVWELA